MTDQTVHDTERAPSFEAEKRDTKPPGSDAIDDPKQLAMVARLEDGIDVRFKAMEGNLSRRLDVLLEAVRNLADETSKANDLRLQVERIRARCPLCRSLPPEGTERHSSNPPAPVTP